MGLPLERLEKPVIFTTQEAIGMLACLTLAGQAATVLGKHNIEETCRVLMLKITEHIGLDIAEMQSCHDLLVKLED